MSTISHDRLRTIIAVYGSGLLQGIALVLFPAAGTLLTDPDFHDLSSSQFGALFTPQLITAIIASLLAARVAQRFGMKRVLRLGLACDALALILLATSQFFIGSGSLPFLILLAATASLGAGFGFTLTALNAYAFDLFPGREDSAVTALHVFTGMGQAGASLTLGLFIGLGFWWGAPLAITALIAVMIVFQFSLVLTLSGDNTADDRSSDNQRGLPVRAWLFAVVAFAYGGIEGTVANWAPIYLEADAGLTMADAALGLSLFWIGVAVGRVIFSALAVRMNVKPLYVVAPLVIGALFVLLPTISGPIPNFVTMAGLGLAASFYFPYTISLASAEFPRQLALISGLLVSSFQVGFGLSANLIGFASETVTLSTIYQISAGWALLIAGIVIYMYLLDRSKSQSGLNGDLPCVVLPCPQHHTKKQAAS